MNRIALPTTLAFVLAGCMAFAQQPAPASPATQAAPAPIHVANPRHQAAKLAKELNLTPDQTEKIEPILADRDQKIAALRTDTTLAPKALKKQMHAVQQSAKEQMDAVLTPEQAEQLKTLQHAHAPKSQPAPAPTPMTPPSA
jgi:Spy/CpxP family protein refolding chaperone